jgi:DNA-binding winged helix-turn-helix (wHTH) protein
LNARYFDALTLLVAEQGKLVSKDRFLDEVWRGIPVTDEALTQCIRTLRRQLGDDAAAPRFIETVPKHGYRFIAAVEEVVGPDAPVDSPARLQSVKQPKWRDFLLMGGAGTLGGGIAGAIGGLLYGFAAAANPMQPGVGAASVVIVILLLTITVALIGAAGVSFGVAAAGFASTRRWEWSILGGACGGLIVGATVKLLGLDAFNLLYGQSPWEITGPAEGAMLGVAVGFGMWLASRWRGRGSLRLSAVCAAALGGLVGLAVPLIQGRLLGGSLDLLARHFPNSRLRLDPIGRLFGEEGFGPVSQAVTACLEGALFAGCVVGAMVLARRSLSDKGEVSS